MFYSHGNNSALPMGDFLFVSKLSNQTILQFDFILFIMMMKAFFFFFFVYDLCIERNEVANYHFRRLFHLDFCAYRISRLHVKTLSVTRGFCVQILQTRYGYILVHSLLY